MDSSNDRRTADPVEDLLANVVELGDADQATAVDALCAEHPDLADAIREHYALYRKLVDGGAPSDGDRFGDYELIRPLGSGGMGVVWLARQRREGVDRTVALKMIRGGGLRSPDARERFRREARAAFRIEHPAICPVYDVGEVDGTPFLAMRHVPGRSLAEWIADARRDGRPLELPAVGSTASDVSSTRDTRVTTTHRPLNGVLEFVESVARALHAAHDAGLVHRDVKPGNIMVTPVGEPVLLDFGLVRDADDDSSLTLSGQPLGTPSYMAPEQISPRGRTIDRTVDVYGLGATLYECVTLEPPFRAETREGLYRRILEEEPKPVRRRFRALPKDLDAILETALRKEPERRYRTALDFAEDLRALRRFEPVRARAAGPLTRTVLWMRRNRLASAVLGLLAIALVFAVVQAREAEHRAEDARRARDRAERGFTLARGAVDELVRTSRERLRDVPRAQPIRSALLERALAFHESLALDLDGNPDMLGDVGAAWRAVASLQIELGQLDAARGAVERAEVAARQRVVREDTPMARADVADTALVRGLVARATGRNEEAEVALEAAIEGYRQFQNAARDPANLFRAEITLVTLLHETGRTEDALIRLDDVEALIDESEARGMTPARVHEERAFATSTRARIARDLQRFEQAAPAFERAIVALRALSAAAPEDRTHKQDLANTLLARGRMRLREGLYEESLADTEDATALFSGLVRDFPDSTTYAGSLATAWNNRYVILTRLDRREEAAESLENARELLQQVLEVTQSFHESAADLTSVLFNLGNAVRRREGPAAAIPHYEHALRMLEDMIATRPADLELTRRTAAAAESAAISYLLIGQPEKADPLLATARSRTEEMLRRAPDDPRLLRDLGRLRFNEGARAFEDGRMDDAAAILRDCLDLRSRLTDASPGNMRLQSDELLVRARLAVALLDVDPARAARLAQETLARHAALPEELRSRVESDSRLRAHLGTAHLVAADGASRSGQEEDARAELERAWEYLAVARERTDALGWTRIDALLVAVRLAELAADSGRTSDLDRHVNDAIAVASPLADEPLLGRDVRRAALRRLERLLQLLVDTGRGDDAERDVVRQALDNLTR